MFTFLLNMSHLGDNSAKFNVFGIKGTQHNLINSRALEIIANLSNAPINVKLLGGGGGGRSRA